MMLYQERHRKGVFMASGAGKMQLRAGVHGELLRQPHREGTV